MKMFFPRVIVAGSSRQYFTLQSILLIPTKTKKTQANNSTNLRFSFFSCWPEQSRNWLLKLWFIRRRQRGITPESSTIGHQLLKGFSISISSHLLIIALQNYLFLTLSSYTFSLSVQPWGRLSVCPLAWQYVRCYDFTCLFAWNKCLFFSL